VASVLPTLENLSEDKHVESLLFPCLDEGSTPSSSTDTILIQLKARKINNLQAFFVSNKLQESFLTKQSYRNISTKSGVMLDLVVLKSS